MAKDSQTRTDTNTCPGCGEPVVEKRVTCPSCGHEYRDDDYQEEQLKDEFSTEMSDEELEEEGMPTRGDESE